MGKPNRLKFKTGCILISNGVLLEVLADSRLCKNLVTGTKLAIPIGCKPYWLQFNDYLLLPSRICVVNDFHQLGDLRIVVKGISYSTKSSLEENLRTKLHTSHNRNFNESILLKATKKIVENGINNPSLPKLVEYHVKFKQ